MKKEVKKPYFEAVEVCPYCDCENVYPMWDVNEKGYIAVCSDCGRKIFLCDECLNAEDNEGRHCDWRECGKCSKCMRGEIEQVD